MQSPFAADKLRAEALATTRKQPNRLSPASERDQLDAISKRGRRRYDAVVVCARRHRFRNPTEIRIE